MATSNNGIDDSFTAAVDMSALQYHFVAAGSVAGEVIAATAGSIPNPLGILQNDPRKGEIAAVRLFGLSKLAASGAVITGAASALSQGHWMTSGSDSKGRGANADAAQAVLLDSISSAAGATVTVFLVGPMITPTGARY